VQAVAAVRPAAEKIASHGHGHATFFELTTAMAWWYFRQQGCNACVIEVGLGGRLDSTNVCWPTLSMITSISYDHQAQLGNTLTEIAGEKAGIIKPGVPVVSGATHPEAAAVIQRVARERGCLLRELDRDFSGTAVPVEQGRVGACVFDYRPLQPHWSTSQPRRQVELRLLGRHQIANACLVLASLDILAEQGWQLEESKIREALRHTQVPGRIQSVADHPLTIVDTAHNEASVEALITTLAEYYPDRRRSLVFSASRDKQWKRMLDQLLPNFDRLILTQFRLNPRAVPVETLHRYAEEWKLRSTAPGLVEGRGDRSIQTRDHPPQLAMALTPAEALKLAQQWTGEDELLVIAGSFFLAAEVLEALREIKGQCNTNNAKTE
jgi:dihydrofolate synthase/folylpolyglutamate synthase